MDAWNRVADLRGEWSGGLEEVSQRTNMHRQQCSEGQGQGWVEGGKEGKNERHL